MFFREPLLLLALHVGAPLETVASASYLSYLGAWGVLVHHNSLYGKSTKTISKQYSQGEEMLFRIASKKRHPTGAPCITVWIQSDQQPFQPIDLFVWSIDGANTHSKKEAGASRRWAMASSSFTSGVRIGRSRGKHRPTGGAERLVFRSVSGNSQKPFESLRVWPRQPSRSTLGLRTQTGAQTCWFFDSHRQNHHHHHPFPRNTGMA